MNVKYEIIAFTILTLLAVATAVLCDRQNMEIKAIHARIDLIAEQVGHGNIPRITIARGTVYAGSGEIVISKVEK